MLSKIPKVQYTPYVRSDATGFRLPTSNEWELAARYLGDSPNCTGAIEYPVGSNYWWTPGNYASGATTPWTGGTDTKNVAAVVTASQAENVWDNACEDPVDEKKLLRANALKLYGMSGGVLQWTSQIHVAATQYGKLDVAARLAVVGVEDFFLIMDLIASTINLDFDWQSILINLLYFVSPSSILPFAYRKEGQEKKLIH